MTLCQHCTYAPARADRDGYCSWDCHDHAYEAPGEPALPRPATAPARAPTAGFRPTAPTAGVTGARAAGAA